MSLRRPSLVRAATPILFPAMHTVGKSELPAESVILHYLTQQCKRLYEEEFPEDVRIQSQKVVSRIETKARHLYQRVSLSIE